MNLNAWYVFVIIGAAAGYIYFGTDSGKQFIADHNKYTAEVKANS